MHTHILLQAHTRLRLLGHCYLPNICFSAQATGATSRAIKWCAVGHNEKVKCDAWTINSFTDGDSRIECQDAPTVDECIKKIMVRLWEKRCPLCPR